MFIVHELYVDDKKLAFFLQACSGLVHSMSTPMPVANVSVAKNGKLMETTSTGSAFELFYRHLIKHKTKTFTSDDVKKFLPSIGKSPSSYSYVLTKLRISKRIKSDPKNKRIYIVV